MISVQIQIAIKIHSLALNKEVLCNINFYTVQCSVFRIVGENRIYSMTFGNLWKFSLV